MSYLTKNQIKIIRFITPYVDDNGSAIINLSYLAIYLKTDLKLIKRNLHSIISTLVKSKEGGTFVISKLIIHLSYLSDNKLSITLNKSILDYIFEPGNHLEGTALFKLKGSYKLYQTLKEDTRSQLIYSFEELKSLFGSNYSYGLFKFRVLNPVISEIRERAEVSIYFNEITIKSSKTVAAVEFFISSEMLDK